MAQAHFHAVVRNLYAMRGQGLPLRPKLIQNWVGVVDVNQNFSRRCRQLVQPLDHATGPRLRQMSHCAAGLFRCAQANHFVIGPQSTINQYNIGALHRLPDVRFDLDQTRGIEYALTRASVDNRHADIVARRRLVAMRSFTVSRLG